MYWEAELSEFNTCVACGGGADYIDAYTTLTGVCHYDPNDKCTPVELVWGAATVVVTGNCNVNVSAEDYKGTCGTSVTGDGNDCCVNTWNVTITGNTLTIN